jgi:hypothetical protein
MRAEAKLPATVQFEGCDTAVQLVQGAVLKCVDAQWSAKNNTTLHPSGHPNGRYYCFGTTQALQCRQDGVTKTIMKEPGIALPSVDEFYCPICEGTGVLDHFDNALRKADGSSTPCPCTYWKRDGAVYDGLIELLSCLEASKKPRTPPF